MPERRELYRSPNGDCWFLGREPQDGRAFVIHQPNGPSGGRLSHIELGAFLNAETPGAKQTEYSPFRRAGYLHYRHGMGTKPWTAGE